MMVKEFDDSVDFGDAIEEILQRKLYIQALKNLAFLLLNFMQFQHKARLATSKQN